MVCCFQGSEALGELEQHTEMEKFIELEYSREDEQPTPWAFDELKTARGPPLGDAAAGASTAARAAPFFYGGSQFKLYRQQPVQLPTRQTARGETLRDTAKPRRGWGD